MLPDAPAEQRAPRLNIVGCGRAAGSLARLWLQAETLTIGAVLNRSRASSERAVRALGTGEPAVSIAAMPAAECWLIGTSDGQIEAVSAAMGETRRDLDGVLVFHLAGRFGLEILESLAVRGALVAALHPVRSLTHDHLSLDDFAGTACVAEGSEAALARLEPLIRSIGGLWLPGKAQKWLEHAGLPESTSAAVTHQLLGSTVEDLARAGARHSITGPVVRGDTRTIEAHLRALESAYPHDIDVYRILARTVLELARERGDLDAATLQRFDVLLGGGGS
jgi:predicted short-subunit dehydrogenase-like oxidoreductase (DUF2520 family)